MPKSVLSFIHRQYLEEALGEFQYIDMTRGDFNGRPSNTYNDKDVTLVQNRTVETKVRKWLSRIDTVFNIYFINYTLSLEEFKHVIYTDEIDGERVMYFFETHGVNFLKNNGHEIRQSPEEATILFFSNPDWANSHRLTPWMIIHRIWQSLKDYDGPVKQRMIEIENKIRDTFKVYMSDFIHEIVKTADFSDAKIINNEGKERLDRAIKAIIQSLAMFRSARKDNIDFFDDLIFEMMTDYCINGYVRFDDFKNFRKRIKNHISYLVHSVYLKNDTGGITKLNDVIESEEGIAKLRSLYLALVAYTNKIIRAAVKEMSEAVKGQTIAYCQ